MSSSSRPNSSFRARLWEALGKFSPATHRLVFTVAASWHALAARYFIVSPFNLMRRLTYIRPVSFVSAEVVQYLGGMNVGYAVLALQGLFLTERDVESRKRSALVLAIANASQLWFNFKFITNGRWSASGLVPILVGDAVVFLLSFAYYLQQENSSRSSLD